MCKGLSVWGNWNEIKLIDVKNFEGGKENMSIRERLSGNEAAAIAMKQINPDVVAAFPITPSTEIPQYFSTFVSNGTVDTEFVAVESEHSAMSACIGAEAARSKGYDSNICEPVYH